MKKLFIPVVLLVMFSCDKGRIPSEYTESVDTAMIYPDYHDVTVPCNIAPLTFYIENACERSLCRLSDGTHTYIYKGRDIRPSFKEWGRLRGDVTAEIYVRRGGKWTKLIPFTIRISEDEIDPYISYRLIAPSYVTYEDLTICQRNLTTYDESVIYGNMINSNEENGQCINCHSFQNYNPERMQFHVREYKAGTVITYDGKTERVDMKTGKTVGAGTYPAWHPTEKLIAYSTNMTGQTFHTNDVQKVEVQDAYSDLMLYDVEAHTVQPLPSDSNDLDCFPHWSPDGKYLYYCSAHYLKADTSETITKDFDMIVNYQKVRYNLYRRSFEPRMRTFGEKELVFDAEKDSMSATLPRISPDGRWLMFTMAPYGVFHIWHKDADIYMMNLATSELHDISVINSPDVESYHSWSSNGRWVVFSSRRDDGNYTRPFITHIAEDGTPAKPFEIPCKDPLYNRQLLRSYNIPEFMTGPVTIRPQQLADIIRNDSIKAL